MLFLLLFALLLPSSSSSDPLEKIVSNFVLTVRSLGEKWLANAVIPRLEDVNSNPSISYSIDDKTANALTSFGNFLNTCPVYLPVDNLEGRWFVVFVSRRLLETTLNDVHQAIDRLSSSQPLSARSTLDSLFRSTVDMECAQLTVVASRFEWAYTYRGALKSIIGSLLPRGDRSVVVSFTPTTEVQMAASLSTYDALVLSHIDSWPPCDNHIVLVRNRAHNTSFLRERMTLTGGNLPSNPLIPVSCQTPPPSPTTPSPPGSIVPVNGNEAEPPGVGESPWSSQVLSGQVQVQDLPVPSALVGGVRNRIRPASQASQLAESDASPFDLPGRGVVQAVNPPN